MVRRLFMGVIALMLLVGVLSAASTAGEGKETAKSSYVGTWKLEIWDNPGESGTSLNILSPFKFCQMGIS